MTIAALLLAGCAIRAQEQAWASAVRSAEGVAAADWSYRNNWPSSGPSSTGSLALEAGLTEEQAADLAEISCGAAAQPLDRVSVETSAGDDAWRVSAYDIGDSCFDAERLVRFAAVVDAAATPGAAFRGEVDIAFPEPDEPVDPSAGDDRWSPLLRLTTTAPDAATMRRLLEHAWPAFAGIDAAVELQYDAPQGSALAREAVELRLAAGDAPAALPRLLEAALAEDHRAIRYENGTLTVEIGTSGGLPEAANRLRTIAEGSGVDVETRLPRMAGSDDPAAEQRVVDAALALPLTTGIEFPEAGSVSSPGPRVRVSEMRGLDPLVLLLVEQNPGRVPFRILGPGEDQPLELDLFGGALSADETLHLYDVADELRNEVAGVEFVMVRVLPEDRTLLRVDIAASATASEARAVRERVRELVPDPALHRIIISDPATGEFSEEIKDDAAER